jgi:hypothetical protein
MALPHREENTMTEWLPPRAGDTIGDWTVVSTERSYFEKFVSLLMNPQREMYRVAYFAHGRPWERMLSPKDYTEFMPAAKEYDANLG